MKLNVSHMFGKTNQVVRFYSNYDCWIEDEDNEKMTRSDNLHPSLYNVSFIPNGDLIQTTNMEYSSKYYNPDLPSEKKIFQNWLSDPQQFGVSFDDPHKFFYLDGMLKYDVEEGCLADPEPRFIPWELVLRCNYYDHGWPTLSTACNYDAFI